MIEGILAGVLVFLVILWMQRRDRQKAKLWSFWYRPSSFGAYEVRYEIKPNWQGIFEAALGPLSDDENGWMTKLGVLHQYLATHREDQSEADQLLDQLRDERGGRRASDKFYSLLWNELGAINLKCWYNRDTDLVRAYWVGHCELEDDFIEKPLWPYGGGPEWVRERVNEVRDAWPEFGELVRDETMESLIDWAPNVNGWSPAPGSRIYISPFGVGFVEQGDIEETINGRGLGTLPTHEINRLLNYLLDQRGYNTHWILSFPPEVEESLVECGAKYVGDPVPGRFEDPDREVLPPPPGDMSKHPALVKSGIALGDRFVKKHWFETKGCSIGFSLKPLDLS